MSIILNMHNLISIYLFIFKNFFLPLVGSIAVVGKNRFHCTHLKSKVNQNCSMKKNFFGARVLRIISIHDKTIHGQEGLRNMHAVMTQIFSRFHFWKLLHFFCASRCLFFHHSTEQVTGLSQKQTRASTRSSPSLLPSSPPRRGWRGRATRREES